MEVMRGLAGSSEKTARQVCEEASGHSTWMASAVEETRTGPGRTPLRSAGTVAAAQSMGMQRMAIRTESTITLWNQPSRDREGADAIRNVVRSLAVAARLDLGTVPGLLHNPLRLRSHVDDSTPRFRL